MTISPGTRIDRYQITSPIASGGMGEIYLAQDIRLGRKVALKLLPAKYTQDQDRLRRFEQEAYAASALNHPNIITIFEIGEADGRHFIATEFIEGTTLRKRLLAAKFTCGEVLEIATQVVSALASAHAAGIVHRDIKPENIMIRPDGYVKILDFGLAKLTEKAMTAGSALIQYDTGYDLSPTESSELTEGAFSEPAPGASLLEVEDIFTANTVKETTPGLVMGTAHYMSPEQARGRKIDARTDIFSFGIVLYEMVTGRLPFEGHGSREVISSILSADPPPLVHYQPQVPEVLEWITAKALVKDREERYQTAKEMLYDLRRLHHRLALEQELSRNPISVDQPEAAASGANLSGNSTRLFDNETNAGQGDRMTKFLDQRISSITRSRFSSSLLMIATAALLLAAGFGIYQFIKSRLRAPASFQQIAVSRFTTSGKATRAAISPDGRYVVYSQREAGRESLLVRQVSRSNNVVIVQPAEVVYRGMTYSRDGNFIYYVVQEQNNPINAVYQVPGLGGVPRKILVDCDSPIALSPAGTQFAFVRRSRGKSEDSLIIAEIDGSNERTLAIRRGADFFWASGPSWSPDGKIIACPAGTNAGSRQTYVAEVRVADGQTRPISNQKWTSVGRVAWTSDGRGLLASAMEQGSTLTQIWYLPYPDGTPRRITNDINDYRDMSLTQSATALATVQFEAHVNLWLLPGDESNRAKKITEGIGQYDGVRGLTWTPDNRLVYVSRASGSQDIWIMDADGKNNTQLTTIETRADIYPAVTPDGRSIIFVSTRTGNSNIYRLDTRSGDQTQLTRGAGEEFPEVTADGKWVIYTDTSTTNFTLWKVAIDGGEPIRLTNKLSQWPDVSPDGSRIACWYRAQANARWQIAILPITGGDPERVIDVPNTAETPIPIRWMPDGTGISFADTQKGVTNIWTQPLAGGPPRQLTNFMSDQIFWFDWSRDGKHLACSRGTVTNDVVLIDEAK